MLLTATPMQNSIFEIENILAMVDGRDVARNNVKFLKANFSYINPTMTINNRPVVINEQNIIVNFNPTTKIWEFDSNIIYDASFKNTRNNQTDRNQFFNNVFRNRIIEYSDISKLPKYVERIYFVNLNTSDENELISILKREGLGDRNNIEALSRNSFGSLENKFVFSKNIKQAAILDLIMRRENTSSNQKLSNFNIPSIYDFQNNPIKYKYIIFCSKIENLNRVKELLISNYIPSNLIGEIKGGMSITERKKNADKYDRGEIRFMLLTEAGEEGVDFKRTALIILADFVYTPSEYQQIIGRAVRLNSNLPDSADKYTSIPDQIECYSIINTFVGNNNYIRNRKLFPIYSYEVLSLKTLLEKRVEINKFTSDISRIFYGNTTGSSPIGIIQSPSTKRIVKRSKRKSGRKKSSKKSKRRKSSKKSKRRKSSKKSRK